MAPRRASTTKRARTRAGVGDLGGSSTITTVPLDDDDVFADDDDDDDDDDALGGGASGGMMMMGSPPPVVRRMRMRVDDDYRLLCVTMSSRTATRVFPRARWCAGRGRVRRDVTRRAWVRVVDIVTL